MVHFYDKKPEMGRVVTIKNTITGKKSRGRMTHLGLFSTKGEKLPAMIHLWE